VGLEGLEGRLFRSLSGGQRQRTLLARALACGADLLLLDEPTSGMDLAAEKAVMDLIAGLEAEGGRTVLFVTHQLNLVANYARTIAILKDGRLISGPAGEILDEGRLSSLYGLGVRVDQVGDRRVVVAL
jgi:ABC-type Mn2+/Zn2+ transport system ATPase subunit